MKRTNTLSDNLRLLTKRCKFGCIYTDAVIDIGDLRAELPVFEDLPRLNEEILEVVSACLTNRSYALVRLTYAEPDRIALSLNGERALNFSKHYNALVPPSMVLKLCGLNKRDVNRALAGAGKRLTPIYDTLRFSSNGVRVDACANKKDTVTVRVTRLNKK